MKATRPIRLNRLNRYFSAILFTMSLPAAYAADGTWNSTTSANWNVATNPPWAGGTVANGAGFTANFNTLDPTADVTVTLGVDRTIGNLTFGDTDTATAAGWVLASGFRLYLSTATGTAPVVTANALGTGKEATISSILMGTQGFTKEGAGILTLTADNNGFGGITGGIVVNNGILKLNRANGCIRGELTINSGGEVRQNAGWSLGSDGGNFSSNFPNKININGGILNFAVLGGGLVANVNMTGGEIKSNGNGNVDWYNTPVGGSRTLTTLASGSTALVSSGLYLRMGNNNGGTAIFDVADGGAAIDFKISGGISEQVGGTQNLLKKGDGTMELSNGNSFAGSTKVAAGVLKLTNNLALQSSALDTSGAGTVTLTVTTPRLGGLMGSTDLASVITSGYSAVTTLQLSPGASKTLTYSGIIANGAANMALSMMNSGTQILSGANTYSGTTSITSGTLIARSASALGTGNVTVGANTRLLYAAATDAQLALGGTLAITGGASTTIGGSIGSTTTSAQINVTGAATISNAAHKVNIYGIDGVSPAAGTNTYTLVHGGVGSSLNPATAPTLGTVYNATNFTVGALSRSATDLMVDITSATAMTSAYWKGTATAGITKVWAASNGSTDGNWASTAGGSVQSLVPASTTDVFISADSPLGAAPTATTLGANLSIKSLTIQDTTNGLSMSADGYTLTLGTGGITMNAAVPNSTIGANVALGADQIWTNNSVTSKTLTVSGAVSGAHALTKAGTGEVILSGNNTYTGATTISAGTLSIAGAGQLGGGSYAGNIANAGTLNYNGATDQTLSGIISGAGVLVKFGDGRDSKLTLTGVNTYTGATSFYRGSLEIGGAGQLNSGNYAGTITTDSNAGWAGTLFYNSTANQILSGVISGAGSLTKMNSSTLTLSVANTFSGITKVEGGILALTHNQAIQNSALDTSGAGVVTVTGTTPTIGGLMGGNNLASVITTGYSAVTALTLNLNANAVLTYYGVIANGAANMTLTKSNTASTQILSGINTYSGSTTVSGGTLEIGGAGQLGSGSYAANISISNGSTGTFFYNSTANQTLGGVISGNGAFTKAQASTLTLSGLNTFSGPLSVREGTLSIADFPNAIPTSSVTLGYTENLTGTLSYTGGNVTSSKNITMATGGTGAFEVTTAATNLKLNGVMSGSGALAKTGDGTLTLGGTNTYTGATTVSAGSLMVNGSLNVASTVTVASTATLGGTGTVNGTVTANGTIAPGIQGTTVAAIGTLNIGVPTFSATSKVMAQIDSDNADFDPPASADLLAVNGALALHASSQLDLSDVGSTTLTAGTKLVILTYTGAWNNVPFSGKGDDTTVTVGINTFTINYNDTDGGNNAVTLTVTAGGDPYLAWVGTDPGGFGLTGPDSLKDADPDGDGVNNLLEFATNSDPTSGSSGPRTYPAMVMISGDNVLTYTIAVRKGDESAFISPVAPNAAKKTATRDSVKYTVEASDSLGVWNTEVVTEVTDVGEISDVHTALGANLTAPPIGSAWEWKTFRAGAGVVVNPVDFIRLHVEEVP